MTTYLLDVNVLIALTDPAHVQHEPAHDWFARTGQRAWATCPLTENGLLRITHSQVIDSYLLVLAQVHCGRLASLDCRRVVDALRNGAKALHLR